MLVRDYMTGKVVTANLLDGLRQTWDRMHERRVRHMPVVDEHGALVGIVSDRDLRRPANQDEPNTTHYFALDNTVKVEEAMTAAPVTVREDDPVDVALQIFVDRRFGALPVIDGAGALVGLISTIDLLRACRDRHAL